MIYCGVDGGQTSTKCVIGTEDGTLIGAGRGGALIHLNAEGGRARFVASITQAIDSGWRNGQKRPESITSIVVGATGIFEDTIEVPAAIELLSPKLVSSHLNVCSDALIALMGAHAGAPGIMVIAGTGTIAYGMDPSGDVARAGGWGWPLGDHGSAFSIGRAGIQAALFASDLMGPETTLVGLMLEHFQVQNVHDIKRLYFSPDFGAPGFASLAPLVAQAASAGDEVAQEIIVENGKALAKQAYAVTKKLNFESQTIDVAPIGGAFQHVSGLQEAFGRALSAIEIPSQQRLTTSPPQLPPQSGAFLMALQQDGQAITEQLISRIASWEF